jgi:uncharacterized OB-fold protein
MEKFCGNCGAKLNADVQFCPNCGRQIELSKRKSGEQSGAKAMTNRYRRRLLGLLGVGIAVILLSIGAIFMYKAGPVNNIAAVQSQDKPLVIGQKAAAKTNEERSSTKEQNLNQNQIQGQETYRTYRNGRFGYTIDYPGNFIQISSAGNGDGITFSSPDKQAVLSVYGGNNSTNTKGYYDLAIKKVKGELGYNILKDTWYVVTWKEDGRICYEKMFVGSTSHNGFTFSFPEEQKSQYDNLVINLERSFQRGDTNHSG